MPITVQLLLLRDLLLLIQNVVNMLKTLSYVCDCAYSTGSMYGYYDSGVILDRVSFHGRFVHFHLPSFLPSYGYYQAKTLLTQPSPRHIRRLPLRRSSPIAQSPGYCGPKV